MGTYEYISEMELRQYRQEWQEMINSIKATQPKMVRVQVDKNTTLEIAEGKNIKKILRRYHKARQQYYTTD